ncbi:MAG: N,N-dimethylformamidase beta subunit family domain-containing protein, partial [Actinomycetota bacterium]
MGRLGPFRGTVQPDPPVGEERLRECAWESSARLVVPGDWPSGVYVGKLTAEVDEWQSYVTFVVRDDRPVDFLFHCATNTWQAYNRWPNFFGLYNDGKKHWYWGPGVRVSYDRPYAQYSETGIVNAPLTTGSGSFLLWEFPLAFWMEKEGYDVSYVTSVDVHEDPDRILRARTFLSVGHDEYWSPESYRHVERAIASGVHAAFLCGNAVFGIVPFGPSTAGAPNRTLTRAGVFTPNEPLLLNRPEQKLFKEFGPDAGYLMGARTVAPITGGGDWVCTNEKHWLFEGTGMRNGDVVPGLVGWEWHGGPAPIPGLEVISTGPTDNGRQKGVYTTVLFPGPRKNLVFNAATIWWGLGLSEPPGYLRPGKVYV